MVIDHRGKRSVALALVVAALAAIALWLGWPREPAQEPSGPRPRASRHKPREALAPATRKPHHEGGQSATSPADRWASEQPPPEYVGEPTDAGRGAPPPIALIEDMDPRVLRARRWEMVRLLDRDIVELERETARAQGLGNDDYAGVLRARLERHETRRAELMRVLEE